MFKLKLKKNKNGRMIPDYEYRDPLTGINRNKLIKRPFGIVRSYDPHMQESNIKPEFAKLYEFSEKEKDGEVNGLFSFAGSIKELNKILIN